jgi:5-methyltetrahydrofolate--homocysteine methyltransferase
MQRQGMTMPLLIGGATTSEIHTAVKIAPHYEHPVVYVADASRAIGVVSALLNPAQRPDFMAGLEARYAQARERFARKDKARERLTLAAARANAFKTDWSSYTPPVPRETGVKVLDDVTFADLRPYIDWSPFFYTWGLMMKYPRILEDAQYGEEAQKLYRDANAMLDRVMADAALRPRGVMGIFPAAGSGDDIIVYADAARQAERARVYGLRQQDRRPPGKPHYCLSDFIAPAGTGVDDHLGVFAVTAGEGMEALIAQYDAAHDSYNAMLAKAVADRLAEAYAEYLHARVRRGIWGYAADENLTSEEMIGEQYRGIRPAPGYPANPDHTQKETIWRLLDVEKNTGMRLTESLAMLPASSVSGFYFSHPESYYLSIHGIGEDQLADYAARRGISRDAAAKWLAPLLD